MCWLINNSFIIPLANLPFVFKIKTSAFQNQNTFPQNYFFAVIGNMNSASLTSQIKVSDEEVSNPSLFDLVRTPQMRKFTLILMYAWQVSRRYTVAMPVMFDISQAILEAPLFLVLSCSSRFTSAVVYQGLVLRLGLIEGNLYLEFFISAVIELPSAFLILATIDRLGRRPLFASGTLVAGAACLITAFLPKGNQMASFFFFFSLCYLTCLSKHSI